MTLGNTIVRLREQRGLRAIDIAEMLGVSKQHYYQFEHDKRKPNDEQLQKIADFLDYPIESFEDSEYNHFKTMHQLFNIFRHYPGEIIDADSIRERVKDDSFDDGVYIKFNVLSALMYDWHMKFDQMKSGEISEEDFNDWMDSYRGCRDIEVEKLAEEHDKQMELLDDPKYIKQKRKEQKNIRI